MIAILIITITAFLLSLIIVFIDKSSDTEEIVKLLPGYNCGSCGAGSCQGLANKIIENKDDYKKCRFAKEETFEEYFKNH